jgi:hypothetical protein
VSIQSRIRDAEIFWQENRKEEALLAALSAANDTARRRYPQAKEGKEALALFIAAAPGQLAEGNTDLFDWSFRGGISLGEVLYDVYRSLLQTGKLPGDVELVPGKEWQVHILDAQRAVRASLDHRGADSSARGGGQSAQPQCRAA